MKRLNPWLPLAVVLVLLAVYGLGRHQGAAAERQEWQANANAGAREVVELGESARQRLL